MNKIITFTSENKEYQIIDSAIKNNSMLENRLLAELIAKEFNLAEVTSLRVSNQY